MYAISFFAATAKYILHAGLDTSSYVNIIDTTYSIYRHADDRGLDSAIAPIFLY